MEPMSEKEAFEFLDASTVSHIGVVSDGLPYVTPMSFVVDGGFPHVIGVSIDEISGMCSGRGFSHRARPGRL